MRKTILLLTALTGAAYLLGRRTGDSEAGKHYSPYQRAALIWTSPVAVRVRRTVHRRRRLLRGLLHR